MMGRGLRISLILCILAAGCRPGLPAVVDFPHYAFRNSTTLELMRVERTDTATVFSMRAYYIPDWWFTIDTATCLYADGRRYPLHAASGIVPGTHEYIREAQLPGEGWRDFKLYFDPLPRAAEHCDFLEGESTGGFHFYGIDLTGRPIRLAAGSPDGVTVSARLPEACREPGYTTVRVHIPVTQPVLPILCIARTEGRRPGMTGYASARFDDDGVAVFRFRQRQTARTHIVLGDNAVSASIWTLPGETAELYWVPDRRELTVSRFSLREDLAPVLRYEGAYAAVNDVYGHLPHYRLDPDRPDFAPGAQNGAEYAACVRRRYAEERARLDADASLTPLQRDLAEVLLKGDALRAMCTADDSQRLQYALEHGTDAGYRPLALTDADFAWLTELDLTDSRLLFSDAAEYLYNPAVRRLTDSK